MIYLFIISSYLIGSIPTGLVLAKLRSFSGSPRELRYFEVTSTGRDALRVARNALVNTWRGLEGAVEE